MKSSYQGNSKPYAMALYAAADQDVILPILEALDAKGLNLSYRLNARVPKNGIKRACAVIVFLSAHLIEDGRLEDSLLYAKSMRVPLVCVNLDHTLLNDSINRLLYASNVIFADRYETPELLVERILTAESLKNPTLTKAQIDAAKLATLLLLAGALAIVVVAGLIIWQRIEQVNQARQEEQTEQLPADIAGLLSSGMTEEDLQKIHTLILVGDVMIDPTQLSHFTAWDEIITQMEIDEKTVWSIDGKQVPRGTAADISLIGRMSNLEELVLINQSVTDISPIKTLTNLRFLQLVDCPIENIEAVSGLSKLNELILDQTYVKSLSPLQSCKELKQFIGFVRDCTSLEGLSIPGIQGIMLFEANQLANLDVLSACGSLTDLTIYDAEGLQDISGLSGCTSLTNLLLDGASAVRSSAALSELTNIKQVDIQNCGFTDLSGLKLSRGLRVLRLENVPVRDFSWTSGMNQLTTFMAHGTRLNNFNFLNDLGVISMELHFSGEINDYSGLAAIPNYTYMHLNPKNQNLAAVLPYIVNAKFSTLQLYDCNGIDFSTLPQHINHLQITGGNLTTLEGISILPRMNTLTIEDMNRLSSLEGLADCEELTRVTINSCIRLVDFEDLYQKPYAIIELINLPTSPDLARLQISDHGNLTLDNMSNITDIGPLEACQTSIDTLQLRNMTALTDLSVLKQMHVSCLIVPPQLEEHATQLRDEHYINSYEVYYPEDVLWATDEKNFTLLSLEELDTLPDVLLARVADLTIVGDRVLDPDTQNWSDDWDENGQHFFLVDRVSEELTPVGPGVIDQIGNLAKLTNLQYLSLLDQPLTSLQDIQTFSDLRRLEIRKCPVVDAAAAFTLTQLEELTLFSTQITSIQGIQNLTNLTRVDINNTQVSDLSPLTKCDFGYAMENGGLKLFIGFIPCGDFSALASIAAFAQLDLQGHDAALWLPYLADRPVGVLAINHCKITNDQIASIAAIPQLRELQLCWNEKITDLSPLLACKTLEKVTVNSYSTEAIASVEGKAQFAIEFWD